MFPHVQKQAFMLEGNKDDYSRVAKALVFKQTLLHHCMAGTDYKISTIIK